MATKLKNHYITRAARNTSEALMMAMQLWMQPHAKRGDIDGVQEFVETINAASIKLRDICERHEYNMEAAKSKAPNDPNSGAARGPIAGGPLE